MTINQVKDILKTSDKISFQLPTGELVPAHFHVTEVGKISKNFIDCGGVIRHEEKANFQLWEENDYDHRLHPEKLLSIIELSQNKLGITDLEVEVEYQGATIGKYTLDHDGNSFLLVAMQTDCLAKDNCGIPKTKLSLAELTVNNNSCSPGSGCC